VVIAINLTLVRHKQFLISASNFRGSADPLTRPFRTPDFQPQASAFGRIKGIGSILCNLKNSCKIFCKKITEKSLRKK